MTGFKHLGGPCEAIPTPANEIDASDFDPRIVPQICDGLRRGYIDEEQVIVVIRYRRRLGDRLGEPSLLTVATKANIALAKMSRMSCVSTPMCFSRDCPSRQNASGKRLLKITPSSPRSARLRANMRSVRASVGQGAPATCVGVVSFQFVESFTMSRTKTNVDPPPAVPQVTGAGT